jgi:nickel/cobalt exporter
MSLIRVRSSSATLAALLLLASAAFAAASPSPFGVGLVEPAPSAGGFLPGLFGTIAAWQSSFYRELTGLVAALKTDGTAAFWLCGVSFAYGVLHAAGPGHGKAIVSAYVLANHETARNGAVLALVSALAQAVTAILLVLVAAVALGATSIAMTEVARQFEIGSFALITGLGVLLVWRKILKPLAAARAVRFAPVPVGGPVLAFAGTRGHDHEHHHGSGGHGHHHHHAHAQADHDDHAHGPDCGCAHVPAPDLASGRLDWRKAWTTVAAVGLRPCTGALIVLVFALSQGLLAAGVAATVAMALGTGLTVAVLTLAAVSARGFAGYLSGGGRAGHAVHRAIEGFGALAILLFGLLMLGASLSA